MKPLFVKVDESTKMSLKVMAALRHQNMSELVRSILLDAVGDFVESSPAWGSLIESKVDEVRGVANCRD